uniref:Zinc transporter n=1 Tax=Peronospora matthiolae TaxID=2874970 RepID=A0AAV1UBD6_9STRA
MSEWPRRPHVLLLCVAILSLSLLSTAEDEELPVTPAVLTSERYRHVPSTANHDHDHDHEPNIKHETPGRFSIGVWSQALLATALVGTAPVLVLLAVPLGMGSHDKQQPLLRVFLSFAAGGLLGDALLHLLPHSLPNTDGSTHDHKHNHDHNHDHGHNHGHEGHGHPHSVADLYVWLWTLAGILSFLMLEKFVRAQSSGGGGHSHGHAHSSASVQDGCALSGKTTTARKRSQFKEGKDDSDTPDDETVVVPELEKKPVAAAAYLNLAADFSHNFTDGLAIGATFVRGNGWTTTVAMLLHELPHEIGDFAILIQSGFTRREAMATQLLTAVGAMIGTVVGLLVEGAGDSSSAWISPFTAGGFTYIACASVMPELLSDCSLAQSLKEGAAMCAGIGLMALIAVTE